MLHIEEVIDFSTFQPNSEQLFGIFKLFWITSIILFGFVLNGHVILTLCGQEAGEFSRATFVLEMC